MMTKQKTETMVKVLGGIAVVLSMFCLCGNAVSVIQVPFMSNYEASMVKIQEEQNNLKQQKINNLREKIDKTDDQQERERLEREIESIENAPDPTASMSMMLSPGMRIFQIVAVVLGGIGNILLAIGGIGLLMLLGWGRSVSLAAAVFKIVAFTGTTLYNALVIMPETMKIAMESMQSAGGGPPASVASGVMGAVMFGTAIGSILVVSAFPIALLVLLNRKDVKMLLAGQWPEEQEGEEDDDLAPREAREF